MTDLIEDKINQLKNKAIAYGKLSDQDKMINIAEYNQIIIEKEQYVNILNTLKTPASEIPETNIIENDISEIMKQADLLKNKINTDDISITELIDLHTQIMKIGKTVE